MNLIFLGVANEKGKEGYVVADSVNKNLSKQSDFSKSSVYSTTLLMPNASADRIKGDVNFDGSLDIMDATYVQRHAAEFSLFNKDQLAVADVTGDGIVDVADATQIQKIIAK